MLVKRCLLTHTSLPIAKTVSVKRYGVLLKYASRVCVISNGLGGSHNILNYPHITHHYLTPTIVTNNLLVRNQDNLETISQNIMVIRHILRHVGRNIAFQVYSTIVWIYLQEWVVM